MSLSPTSIAFNPREYIYQLTLTDSGKHRIQKALGRYRDIWNRAEEEVAGLSLSRQKISFVNSLNVFCAKICDETLSPSEKNALINYIFLKFCRTETAALVKEYYYSDDVALRADKFDAFCQKIQLGTFKSGEEKTRDLPFIIKPHKGLGRIAAVDDITALWGN